jgi:hypothetical protein
LITLVNVEWDDKNYKPHKSATQVKSNSSSERSVNKILSINKILRERLNKYFFSFNP